LILIIGITGASGAIYGIRLLEVLSAYKEIETHLIVSGAAEEIIKYERHNMNPTRYSVKGMPDIMGFVTYERPDGKPWARLLGIECKGPKGKATEEQVNWGEMCESRGGIWILAYSVECVEQRLRKEGFDV